MQFIPIGDACGPNLLRRRSYWSPGWFVLRAIILTILHPLWTYRQLESRTVIHWWHLPLFPTLVPLLLKNSDVSFHTRNFFPKKGHFCKVIGKILISIAPDNSHKRAKSKLFESYLGQLLGQLCSDILDSWAIQVVAILAVLVIVVIHTNLKKLSRSFEVIFLEHIEKFKLIYRQLS